MRSIGRAAPAFLFVISGSWPAHAERVPGLTISSWVAPAGCPDKEQIRADVLRLAGPESRARKGLIARATIERDGEVFRLVLTTDFDGSTGERRLSASSCGALTDAAVLVLALIMNPEARVEPHGAPEREAPPVRRDAEESLTVRALVGAYAGVDAGVAGSLGPQFGGGAGIAIERLSLRLSASYAPSRDVRLSGSTGPGARLWFVSASALGCSDFGTGIILSPCAGASVTWLSGRGIDVTSPESAEISWVSVKAGIMAGLPVGHFVTFQVAGYAHLPLRRPVLYFDDLGPVEQPESVGAELRAGAELALP